MIARKQFITVAAVFLCGSIALLGRQYRTTASLRAAIAQHRAEARAFDQLKVERQHLLAAQVPPDELARLRAERSRLSALLVEIEGMKRRAEATTRTLAARNLGPDRKATAPSLKGRPVASDRWQNTGQASPEAAFQTLLWAAAGGDVEALAGVLAFDNDAREKAASLFAQLPAALRAEVGTPDRLMALLTSHDVALGSAQILAQYSTPDGTKIAARIIEPDGKSKQMLLSLRADGDRWRLVVPASAVETYRSGLSISAARQ